MKHVLVTAITLSLGLVASTAAADESQRAVVRRENVTTLTPTTVHGRPQKPGIVIMLTRARMQLGATTPTLASITTIQDASKKDPF